MQSITWRLVRWYALILFLILMICGGAAFLSMRYLLYSQAAREVNAAIATVKKMANPDEQSIDAQELTASIESRFLWIQITAADGRVLNRSRVSKAMLSVRGYAGPPKIIDHFLGEEAYLAGVTLSRGVLVQIVRPLTREEHFLKVLAGVFGILALAGIILAAFGGWLITRAAMRPIRNFTKTARSISTTDLSRRISLTGPHDELYHLGATFNQMLDRLEEGFQGQQQFLNAASHDLRTPLAVIRSYSDILNRWGKDEPAVIQEALPAIAKAVRVMERLVNDLLLLAKLQSSPPLKVQPLSLTELTKEVIKEAQAISPNITIYPKQLQAVEVQGDEIYVRRAIWVLVDNAIKYNRTDGNVFISLTLKAQNEAVLQVEDNGPGISEIDLPRIFERFYRGDRSRSSGKGFGLGLTLAKEIVEAHHGRIEVNSQLGIGSVFRIILPISDHTHS